MIAGFDYKEQYLGTGDTTAYDFTFFVTDPSQIHLYIQDQNGNIVTDTTGDDTDWVAGCTIDNDDGSTLTLAAVLPNNYVLTMFLANDTPSQPTDFPNKNSFTLTVLEGALDFVVSLVERVAFLSQRAIRLHDLDDIDNFDMRLPINLNEFPGAIIEVNTAGNGFSVGSSEASLTASILEAAELTMATALAEGIAEAIAGFSPGQVYVARNTIAAGNNLNIDTTNFTLFTEVDYTARIQRAPNVYAKQMFSIFYRNGAWELALQNDLYADLASDHGITFTVTAGGAINAAVANDGNGNATIDLLKTSWAT